MDLTERNKNSEGYFYKNNKTRLTDLLIKNYGIKWPIDPHIDFPTTLAQVENYKKDMYFFDPLIWQICEVNEYLILSIFNLIETYTPLLSIYETFEKFRHY